MTNKINGLTVLAIITVIMVILMLITLQRPTESNSDYALLFPGLFDQLSKVNTITVKSSQDDFTLYKKGEDWFIKQRWDHPADFDLVKRTLIDMSEAKIIERKTADPEYYPLLGVAGMEQGGDSIEITLLNNDITQAGLILGNEREIGRDQGARRFYVRRAGEARAWLAEGYLNINPLMLNWIKSEVINIDRERIAQVNIIQPNGEMATIVNLGEKDKFGTPESLANTVFKYPQLGYDIAGTLFQLRMEDVQPVSEFSRAGSEVVIAEFITFDGLVVTVATSFIDGAYYSEFNAEYDPDRVSQPPNDILELDKLKTAQQVQQEATMLNNQLANWVYRFGGFIGTNLMRAKADMVTEPDKAIPMPADITGIYP